MKPHAKTALSLTLAIVGGMAAGMRCDASEWVDNSSQINLRPAAYTVKAYTGGSDPFDERLMAEYKAVLRPEFGKSYRHDLLNHLFYHPYTKIDHTTEALGVTRMTASAYLDKIVKLGLLSKFKVGRVNYYINEKLVDLLVNHEKLSDSK